MMEDDFNPYGRTLRITIIIYVMGLVLQLIVRGLLGLLLALIFIVGGLIYSRIASRKIYLASIKKINEEYSK